MKMLRQWSAEHDEAMNKLTLEMVELISTVQKRGLIDKETQRSLIGKGREYIRIFNSNKEASRDKPSAVDDTLGALISKSWPILKDCEPLGLGLAISLSELSRCQAIGSEAGLLLRAFSRVNEVNHEQYFDPLQKKEQDPGNRTKERDKIWKVILENEWALTENDVSNIVNYAPEKSNLKEEEINSYATYSLLKVCKKVESRFLEMPNDPINKEILQHFQKMQTCLNDPDKSNKERLSAFSEEKSKVGQYRPQANSAFKIIFCEIELILDTITLGAYSTVMNKDVWRESKSIGFFKAVDQLPSIINQNNESDAKNSFSMGK